MDRFYFSSPLEATYHYTDSSTRFDWVSVYEDMKRSKALLKIRKQKVEKEEKKPKKEYSGEPQNTLPEETMFDTKNGRQAFKAIRDSLSVGQKITCKCVEGIDHGGLGASHHSAFIQKSDNGNVFYSCSGGRCASVGTLWCAGWKE